MRGRGGCKRTEGDDSLDSNFLGVEVCVTILGICIVVVGRNYDPDTIS